MLLPTIVDVSPKGQILIPADIRKALGIKPKGQVFIKPDSKQGKMEVKALTKDNIIDLAYGMLASNDGKSWTKELEEERRRDLIREETKLDVFFQKKSKHTKLKKSA